MFKKPLKEALISSPESFDKSFQISIKSSIEKKKTKKHGQHGWLKFLEGNQVYHMIPPHQIHYHESDFHY